MAIASTNPATGELLQTFDALTEEQIDEKLATAAAAFRSYRTTTFAERADWLRRAADILDAEADALGRLATLEMGKTLASAVAEVGKCATACRYYAEHAEAHARRRAASRPTARRSFTRYEPLGPVLAIMPWNFPFWQVFRFAAPALMAGNVGLLKHASNVPQCALAIEDILRRAGFPEGAFQTLLIGSAAVEAHHRRPARAAVTLTGSEAAGRASAPTAGRKHQEDACSSWAAATRSS